MKKLIAIALALTLSLGLIGCKKAGIIPTLEEIKTEFYTDDEIENALFRVTREELREAWGEPDRVIDRENEDVWILEEGRVLVISYNILDRVDDAETED